MGFVYFLLFIVTYLVIGGIVDWFNKEEFDDMIFFWPAFLFIFFALLVERFSKAVGHKIASLCSRLIRKGDRDEG